MLSYMLYAAIYLSSLSSGRHLSDAAVAQYAHEIERQSLVTGVDSLLFVTIITHESQWHERAISKDGLDYGFMQVRKLYYSGKPEWLLNGTSNIQAGAVVINRSIDFCRKFLGREPKMQEYLACYTGSCTNRYTMCRPTRLTQHFENYQQCLLHEVTSNQSKSECQKYLY